MSKINLKKMSMKEILLKIGVNIKPQQIYCIMKDPIGLYEHLQSQDLDIEDIDMRNILLKNEDAINKEKLIFCTLLNLKHDIEKKKRIINFLDEEEIIRLNLYEKWYKMCLDILENSNVQFPYITNNGGYLTLEKILTMQDILHNSSLKNSKNNKKNDKNKEILEKVGNKFRWKNLLSLAGIGRCGEIITYDSEIGNLFQYIIKNNIEKRINEIDYECKRENLYGIEMDITLEEENKIFSENMELFDLEKMLLLSAYNAKKILEEKIYVNDKEYAALSYIMKCIGEILSNSTSSIKAVKCSEFIQKNQQFFEYSSKILRNDLERIVKIGEEYKYYSKKDIEQEKIRILNREKELIEYSPKLIQLMNLDSKEIDKLVNFDGCNYYNLMLCDSIKDSQIREIFERGIKDFEFNNILISYLYENKKISKEDIINCFMKENTSIKIIEQFNEKEHLDSEITTKKLIEYYDEMKNDTEKVKDFNRYALLFREIKLKNKTKEEQIKIENQIVEKLYEKEDREYEEDLENLYESNLLSIETVIDWGDNKLIYELMKKNALKSKDAKKLLEENVLDIQKVKNMLIRSNFSDSEKLNFIYTTFDGIEEKQKEIRDELMQTLNGKIGIEEKTKKNKEYEIDPNPIPNPTNSNKYVVDPMLRWQFIKSLDKDCTNKMYSRDTAVFILPNINKGMVIIEKLFKNAAEKTLFSYGAATYIMTLEEFYKNKDVIIKNERVNRGKLVDLNEEKMAEKFSHSSNWAYRMLEEMDISLEDSQIYDKQQMEYIEKLAERIKKEREIME